MKNSLIWLTAALALLVAYAPASGQDKLATVKMQKAFNEYWKSAQLKQLLEYKSKELEVEIAEMEKQRKRGLAEFQKAKQELENPGLSEDARRQKAKQAGEIRQSLLGLERKIQQKQRTFRRFSQTEQTRILQELAKLMQAFAARKGYALVVDSSQPVVVVYADEKLDITDAFIAEINKGREKKKEPEKETGDPGQGLKLAPKKGD